MLEGCDLEVISGVRQEVRRRRDLRLCGRMDKFRGELWEGGGVCASVQDSGTSGTGVMLSA